MKKLLYSIFILIIAGAGLFFGRYLIFPGSGELVIAMNLDATDLSPYGLDLNNATRIANIYEGLVGFDRNLKITPALAVSWGNISDTIWEFRLRQGVRFHDDNIFSAQDVLSAFEAARNSGNPQITPYISTIREMTAEGEILRIHTNAPDPLLLSRLTRLFIYKGENIGTGPYKMKGYIPGRQLELERFEDYWGVRPSFKTVRYTVERSVDDRERGFETGKIDLLAAVSQQQALSLPKEQLKTSYGLEVNFLIFKLDDPIFQNTEVRKAVQKLINPATVEAIGNGFIRSASQFVAPGVFGYNSSIQPFEYRPEEEPKELFGKRLHSIRFDYLPSYQTLAEYLVPQLEKAGFFVEAIPTEPEILIDRLQNNESQLYLAGWQAEDGDAGGFFDAFVHSSGAFNKGRYQNQALDRLIEEARQEMNPQKRLTLLQEIGFRLKDEWIGISLFEPSRIYAVKDGIKWAPRLDGLVLASEISK